MVKGFLVILGSAWPGAQRASGNLRSLGAATRHPPPRAVYSQLGCFPFSEASHLFL